MRATLITIGISIVIVAIFLALLFMLGGMFYQPVIIEESEDE